MIKFSLIIIPFVIACSSPEVTSCKDGEGYSLGYQDALYGHAKSPTDTPEKSCKKYQQGFASGLKKFCRSEYGYEFGIQGQIYKKTCPKTSEEKFLNGYLSGRKKFLNDEINDRKGLIQSINSDLKIKEKKSVAEEVTKLKTRKDTVTQEITRLEKDLSELGK
jgi:hypothetical protein